MWTRLRRLRLRMHSMQASWQMKTTCLGVLIQAKEDNSCHTRSPQPPVVLLTLWCRGSATGSRRDTGSNGPSRR